MLFSCKTGTNFTPVRNGMSLPLLLMIVIIIPETLFAYPVFGTKRYGRSTGLPHRVSTWRIPAPIPLQAYQQPQPRSQSHYGLGIASAPAYYTTDPIVSYPYAQDYPDNDYYYAQEPATFSSYAYYPTVGGAVNGNLKYSVYQSLVPYYYGDGHQRLGYGYYGYDDTSDPVDDLQEEIQQEEEREEREEALPIGQETWFEGGGASQRQSQEDSMADVNAAFLQNLIMSQIYNDANSGHIMRHPTYSVVDDGSHDNWMYDTGRSHVPVSTDYFQNSDEELDDEDVRELKSLVKKNRSGELSDHLGGSAGNWFPAVPSKQQAREQAWYPNTHRPEYYEPVWFPTESGPWYENSWTSYKRNADTYQSIRAFTKKQESSEYGPWIPKGTINFSDRKGNAIIPPVSATKFPKVYREKYNSITNSKVKPVGSESVTARYTTIPVPTSTMSTVTSSPVELTSTSAVEFDSRRGQKEVALLRPPTPVRHPFTAPAIDKIMARGLPAPRHGSSVYDTIKQLLNMEQGLRKETEDVDHSRPQKRFVSNEESLVEELSGLKKLAA
ncbi:uncharacterized protein [Periplaneta americana]|uniref:uncharacterized protein n=1 Tax=Periplaneta americana TaxID=6978 RepID=UPI0037E76791